MVTRPEPGLSDTLGAVAALGWEALACPMLEISLFPPLSPNVFSHPARAVLLTSANALPALRDWPRETPIMTVGSATAAKARDAGFERVDSATGDACALEKACKARGLTGRDVILLSGETYGVELAAALGATRVEVYAVRKRDRLPDEATRAIHDGRVEAVLFYSGKTADAFCEALSCEAQMGKALGAVRGEALTGSRALCFSEAIAMRLDAAKWRAVEGSDPLTRLGPCR